MLEPFEMRLMRFAIDGGVRVRDGRDHVHRHRHKLILDKVTIPSIVDLLRARRCCCPSVAGTTASIGIAVGYGVPWLIGELYYRIRKREGLGPGRREAARARRRAARLEGRGRRRCSAARCSARSSSIVAILSRRTQGRPRAGDDDASCRSGPTSPRRRCSICSPSRGSSSTSGSAGIAEPWYRGTWVAKRPSRSSPASCSASASPSRCTARSTAPSSVASATCAASSSIRRSWKKTRSGSR